MPVHPVTEFVILICLGVPVMHMLCVSHAAGHGVRARVAVGVGMLAWSAFAWAAVRYQVDRTLLPEWLFMARPALYLVVVTGIALLLRRFLLGQGVSQHLLIALQLIRPIGLVFVLEWSAGRLPGIFAHPAGWGDLLAGLVAAYVLLRFRGREIPAVWVISVAVVGLADFASAFFFGFTSSATPVQLFSMDQPNTVTEFPLGLIPLFLVPYAVVAHVLSLAQLAQTRASGSALAAARLAPNRIEAGRDN